MRFMLMTGFEDQEAYARNVTQIHAKHTNTCHAYAGLKLLTHFDIAILCSTTAIAAIETCHGQQPEPQAFTPSIIVMIAVRIDGSGVSLKCGRIRLEVLKTTRLHAPGSWTRAGTLATLVGSLVRLPGGIGTVPEVCASASRVADSG